MSELPLQRSVPVSACSLWPDGLTGQSGPSIIHTTLNHPLQANLYLLRSGVDPVEQPADGVEGQSLYVLKVLPDHDLLARAAVQTQPLHGVKNHNSRAVTLCSTAAWPRCGAEHGLPVCHRALLRGGDVYAMSKLCGGRGAWRGAVSG